jgi:hypothetical protein
MRLLHDEMTAEQKRQHRLFENNPMPREYQWTGEKRPFDTEKIRRSTEKGGFWTMAWEGLDLQSNIDALVKDGLVDDLGEDMRPGIQWKERTT